MPQRMVYTLRLSSRGREGVINLRGRSRYRYGLAPVAVAIAPFGRLPIYYLTEGSRAPRAPRRPAGLDAGAHASRLRRDRTPIARAPRHPLHSLRAGTQREPSGDPAALRHPASRFPSLRSFRSWHPWKSGTCRKRCVAPSASIVARVGIVADSSFKVKMPQ